MASDWLFSAFDLDEVSRRASAVLVADSAWLLEAKLSAINWALFVIFARSRCQPPPPHLERNNSNVISAWPDVLGKKSPNLCLNGVKNVDAFGRF